jgi:hypothetical protein
MLDQYKMIDVFDLLTMFASVPGEDTITTTPLQLNSPPPYNRHVHQEAYKEKPSKDQAAEPASYPDPPIRFQRKRRHGHPLQQ